MSSTIENLRADISAIKDAFSALIATISVQYFDRYGGGIIMVAPDYYWCDRSAEQQSIQLKIKRNYENWMQLLQSIFRQAPHEVQRKIDDADKRFRIWLEFQTNWSLGAVAENNQNAFDKDASLFLEILDIFKSEAAAPIIIIPDTNSLTEHQDPIEYKNIAGNVTFKFLLLPTILGELDGLKNLHRNPDFRDKAKKVIQRIKGWRNQGSLRDGVTVDKTITVQAVANEPNMAASLSWLDAAVADDRLIAGVLEIQASSPEARVILVTGDINLLNKAEAARIATGEFDV